MASLTVPFRPDNIPTGLVGYWKFNNDATDSSGSGYTLSATGSPTYATDSYWKEGEKSVTYTGGTGHTIANASCANLNIDGANQSMSVACWAKISATGTNAILNKFSTGGGNNGYSLGTNSATYVEFAGYRANVGASATSGTGLALSVGRWYHICGVLNSATDLIQIFVDGNLVGSAAQAAGIGASTGDFKVGISYAGDPGDVYDGNLKDVAVWSVALTPLQIKSLALGVDLSKYAYRPNNVSTQPTHWWKLNEVSGTRADSIGSATLADNNSVLSSDGYVEGVSADFVATNSEFLSVADSDDWYFDGDFTLRARIKPDALTPEAGIISHGDTSASGGWLFRIDGVDQTKLQFAAGDSTVSDLVNITSDAHGMVAGNFYDVVLRRSGNDYTFWVDGVQKGGGTDTSAHTNEAYPLRIGVTSGLNTNVYFDGHIEDVAIWKGYALTDAEIKSLACALPIQRQGIVSYWKMDEASGNAVDSIGTNTGVETSGTIASDTGKVSLARDFEAGDTEYFEVADNATLDITSDFTILSWMKPESVGADMQIVDRYASSHGYYFGIKSTQKLRVVIEGEAERLSTTSVSAGAWNHGAAIFSGATLGVYFNAVSEVSAAHTTAPTDISQVLRIGAGSAPADYYDGLLDEVVLAKRYFRPEEIKAVYLKGLNGKEVTSSERKIAPLSQAIIID